MLETWNEIRTAEINFVAARHEIKTADIDSARAYGEYIVDAVRRNELLRWRGDPIVHADVLGDIALFGLAQDDEKLAGDALVQASDKIDGITTKKAFQFGYDPAHPGLVRTRIDIIADILEGHDTEENRAQYIDFAEQSKKYFTKRKTRAKTKKLVDGIVIAAGTIGELATLALINHTLDQDELALHTSYLMNGSNFTVHDKTHNYRLGSDLEIIPTNAQRLSEDEGKLIQIKRAQAYLNRRAIPYAPHIGMFVFRQSFDAGLVQSIEQNPVAELPDEIQHRAKIITNWKLEELKSTFAKERKYGIQLTRPRRLTEDSSN